MSQCIAACTFKRAPVSPPSMRRCSYHVHPSCMQLTGKHVQEPPATEWIWLSTAAANPAQGPTLPSTQSRVHFCRVLASSRRISGCCSSTSRHLSRACSQKEQNCHGILYRCSCLHLSMVLQQIVVAVHAVPWMVDLMPEQACLSHIAAKPCC